MQKKEKSSITLNTKLEKMVKGYCRVNNRDVNEFLEEAIAEKIEYDELNKDNALYEAAEELLAADPGDEEFKRKH